LLFLETAPRHGLPVLDENLVDDDHAPEPGMPRASALARKDPGLLAKSGPQVAAPDEPIKGKLAALVAFGDP
jgi:hypothetical protein